MEYGAEFLTWGREQTPSHSSLNFSTQFFTSKGKGSKENTNLSETLLKMIAEKRGQKVTLFNKVHPFQNATDHSAEFIPTFHFGRAEIWAKKITGANGEEIRHEVTLLGNEDVNAPQSAVGYRPFQTAVEASERDSEFWLFNLTCSNVRQSSTMLLRLKDSPFRTLSTTEACIYYHRCGSF